MACIIRLGQPRLLDIVDDAWAQDILPDDDISIPQVPPPAAPAAAMAAWTASVQFFGNPVSFRPPLHPCEATG